MSKFKNVLKRIKREVTHPTPISFTSKNAPEEDRITNKYQKYALKEYWKWRDLAEEEGSWMDARRKIRKQLMRDIKDELDVFAPRGRYDMTKEERIEFLDGVRRRADREVEQLEQVALDGKEIFDKLYG